jgi:hypothetical protein
LSSNSKKILKIAQQINRALPKCLPLLNKLMDIEEQVGNKLKVLLASAWNNRVTPVVWGKGSRKLQEHIFKSQQTYDEKQIEAIFSRVLCGN